MPLDFLMRGSCPDWTIAWASSAKPRAAARLREGNDPKVRRARLPSFVVKWYAHVFAVGDTRSDNPLVLASKNSVRPLALVVATKRSVRATRIAFSVP